MTQKMIIPLEEDSSLEKVVTNLIDKTIRERLIELSFTDVQLIARELMPDLDDLISIKVKQHLVEIGELIIEKFKE